MIYRGLTGVCRSSMRNKASFVLIFDGVSFLS
jgi:hypothetical protein